MTRRTTPVAGSAGDALIGRSNFTSCTAAPAQEVQYADNLQLAAVVVYILSQGFTFPIVAFTRSMYLWPVLSDLATLFLVAVHLSRSQLVNPMDRTERSFWRLLVLGVTMALASTVYTSFTSPQGPTLAGLAGSYQTLRLVEFGVVWHCIRGMAFSPQHLARISSAVYAVTAFIVAVALGQATGLFPGAMLAAHLPADSPWGAVRSMNGPHRPFGPIGINAGGMVNYLTVFTALLLAGRKPAAAFRVPLIAVAAVVVFLTGSRGATVGFATMFVAASATSVRRFVFTLAAAIVFAVIAPRILGQTDEEVGAYAQRRSASILNRQQDPTLSGRTIRWTDTVQYVRSNPEVLITGIGWGMGEMGIPGVPGNAHNMYLQSLLEGGVLGLALYLMLLLTAFRLLRGSLPDLAGPRAAYAGLLVAGFTGEVLWPTFLNGHFLGFTFAMLAIAGAASRGYVQSSRTVWRTRVKTGSRQSLDVPRSTQRVEGSRG
ncbi:O-antigen ligase family protein [candidate division WOR-3 bacterium]|uniref:O-antigen ligase family protein n=1 Tax=candidate division WOR-3 bacterium TaxID=2052148 RepID=A0A937XDL4_UNCW3|nr:O-antigen ligase family protein [candidate division WOR-3 bacterium]